MRVKGSRVVKFVLKGSRVVLKGSRIVKVCCSSNQSAWESCKNNSNDPIPRMEPSLHVLMVFWLILQDPYCLFETHLLCCVLEYFQVLCLPVNLVKILPGLEHGVTEHR